MSTHIKMDEDDFSQITTYHGTLDEKYTFVVELSYNTNRVGHEIDSIEFVGNKDTDPDDETKIYWNKAEDKIKDFVMKWLFEKPKNQGEMENE